MVAWSPGSEEAPTVRLPAARTARVALTLALCAALLAASGAGAAPRPHGHKGPDARTPAAAVVARATEVVAAPAPPSPDSAHNSRPPAPPRMSRVREAEVRTADRTPDPTCDLAGTAGTDPAELRVATTATAHVPASPSTLASKASRTRGQPEQA